MYPYSLDRIFQRKLPERTIINPKPQRLLLAVNPHGGLKRGMNVLERVRPIFERAGTELTVIETEYAGHAREIVKSISPDEYQGFCAIGGDGTLHEVVNGLMTREDEADIPIGLIPAGTGCSISHDLGCLDPIAVSEHVAAGRTRSIDVIEVKMPGETLYAFNVVGWGLVVDVIKLAEKMRWLGYQRYNLATVAQLIRIKLRKARLILDGEERESDFIFVMGCNTMHTGVGMKIAPRAKLDDGLIDLVIVRGGKRLELLKIFTSVFKGGHLASPLVEYRQVSSFSLMPDEPDQLNVDGELAGSTPVEVRVIPRRLTIFG